MWDVISTEMIRCTSMLKRHQDPLVYARYLLDKAVELRFRKGMRNDDITVLCIDINFHEDNFKSIVSKDGYDVIRLGVDGEPMKSSALCFDCNIQ